MSEIVQVIQSQEYDELDAADNDMFESDTRSQYLSFGVGDEEFAVSIISVQEIREWEMPTFLPNSPYYVSGVLNLRGTIVPVIDLRKRFNFKSQNQSKETVIIVLKNNNTSQEKLMGCVVDSVSDVFSVDDDELKKLPRNNSNVDGRFIEGVMTVNQKAVTLLSLKSLLSLDLIEHPFSGGSNDE